MKGQSNILYFITIYHYFSLDLQRTKVKDGFDPLHMFKKEADEKIINEKRVASEERKNEKLKNSESVNIFSSVDDVLKTHSNTQITRQNNPLFSSSNNFNHINLNLNSNSNSSNNVTSALSSNNNNNININPNLNSHLTNSFFVDREYIKNNFDFLKGEVLIDYDEAYYFSENINFIGTIVMTDYRLIFKFKEDSLNEKLNFHEDYFKIPFYHISEIKKTSEKKNIVKYSLDITTKDARVLKFIVNSDQLKFYANLNNLVNPKEASFYYTFAQKYRESIGDSMMLNGWNLYDPFKEYSRQGVKYDDEEYQLRICQLNKNFALCSTYPEFLIVPRDLTDEDIKEASLYRTKSRLPVMSYVYSNLNNLNNANKKTKSCPSIWRSSQTKSGISGQNRSQADEKLLKTISQLSDKLVIFDARPYINALANRIKGGGFENVNNYYNTELHFCEIENIHNVRTSLGKIHNLCASNKIMENKKFWSGLEQTEWYEFIHLIIKYSNEIAICIKKNFSVLVHCSDGWDRSSQLISLSQILIDPFYRSIEGLIVLIEKDWLSFGHQFALRNGIYTKEMHEDQRAPIFLQWLDCLHQLIFQFPNSFEYNMEFILYLASHYNSNLYGTFLYNCELERTEKDAKNKTVSIWTDVLPKINRYTNPFYQKQNIILTPNYALYKLRFWEEFFLKYNNSVDANKIFIDPSKNIFVKTQQNFFNFSKMQDMINLQSTESKMDELFEVLADIYKNTVKNDVFDEFSETTKFYLTNIKTNTKKVISKNEIVVEKEIIKEEGIPKQNEIEIVVDNAEEKIEVNGEVQDEEN